ncbi:MAG: hypothetical protein VYB05_20575 [Pseudomonadota bacterium]|nr:hypothetical protein [Pseudomonadota bacterium]
MASMSLDLSDDLAQLATNFDQFAHGGLVMDGETVLGIAATLRSLHRAARRLENEVSALRWNQAAKADRTHETKRVLAEAGRPGSNVVLFGDACEVPFSDGGAA